MPAVGSSPRAGGHVHDGARTTFSHVRRHGLGQPQRGAHVDIDHEPQVLGRRGERLAQVIRADRVDQHLGPTDLDSDLVDEPPAHGRIGRVARRVSSGNSFSASSLRSTPTTVNPAAASFCAVARPSSPPAPTTIATRPLIPPPPSQRRIRR
jgi:hypothetical protein